MYCLCFVFWMIVGTVCNRWAGTSLARSLAGAGGTPPRYVLMFEDVRAIVTSHKNVVRLHVCRLFGRAVV